MDFRAASGTPVHAANSGTVILARSLFYEGNCVVIDHGMAGLQRLFRRQLAAVVAPDCIRWMGGVADQRKHVARATGLLAVGFTAAGLVAASLPFQLPWVPLVAPLAVLALYVVVTRPFWAT